MCEEFRFLVDEGGVEEGQAVGFLYEAVTRWSLLGRLEGVTKATLNDPFGFY